MSDEHQVNGGDNFHSSPEENSGNSQAYVSQPASSPQGLSDDQQWGSGVSDGRVVVGTENPLPSIPAQLSFPSTLGAPSSVSRLSATFPDPAPSPGGNDVPSLGPHTLAYPCPQQELSGQPTPHSPVAEESFAVQGFPGFAPVEESAGNGTDDDVPESQDNVTGTTNDVTENNVIDDSGGSLQESSQNGEEEAFISVHKKKLSDENRELHERMACIICTHKKSDTFLYPCGHVVLCELCAEIIFVRNDKCPICRSPIKTTVPVKFC